MKGLDIYTAFLVEWKRCVMSVSVCVQVWEGLDVVKMARTMLGETNPADSLPGTIRGDFCVDVSK